MDTHTVIINRTNAEHYVWGECCDGWRLLDRPDLNVTEERIPPGRGEIRHFHQHARQVFFVIAGHLHVEVEGEGRQLGPGDSLEAEPGRVHTVRNTSDDDVFFLVISAPSTHGDRVNVEGSR